MPLQFEAFLPLVVIGAALYAAGPILDHTQRLFNNGKVFNFHTIPDLRILASAVYDGHI